MRIDVRKLEKHGYIVDSHKDIIHIYRSGGTTKLFDALHKTLDEFDVKQAGMHAESMVVKLDNLNILELCQD